MVQDLILNGYAEKQNHRFTPMHTDKERNEMESDSKVSIIKDEG